MKPIYNGAVEWISPAPRTSRIIRRKKPVVTITITKDQLRTLGAMMAADSAAPSFSYLVRVAIDQFIQSTKPKEEKAE